MLACILGMCTDRPRIPGPNTGRVVSGHEHIEVVMLGHRSHDIEDLIFREPLYRDRYHRISAPTGSSPS